MMKNILVLSFFLLIIKSNAHHIMIQLGKLEEEELHYLLQVAQNSNFEKLIITVIPGAQFSCEYKASESFLQKIKEKCIPSDGLISTKTIVMYGFKAFFGTGLLSYITILYFMYRVYKIVKKVQTLMSWLSPEKEPDQTEEALALLEKIVRKKECGFITQQEYYYLRLYKKISHFLKSVKIRKLFPLDEEIEASIDLLLNHKEKIR